MVSPSMRLPVRNRLRGEHLRRKFAVSSSMILTFVILLSLTGPILLTLRYYYALSSGSSNSTMNIDIIANKDNNNNNNGASLKTEHETVKNPDFSAYLQSSQALKEEFYQRYGGKDSAILLLQKTIITFSPSSESGIVDTNSKDFGLHHTAKRIMYAMATKQPFILAFGGYSVTVGRGNYFNQSYPLVLEAVLKDTVKLLGIEHFEVRNGAIGGIPSFPYGWCLKNFLGENSDAVSWDFSMNEGDSAVGLESYLRHALSINKKSPMFIMYQSMVNRIQLLQKYVDNGSISDPIVINYDKKSFADHLSQPEDQRSVGFQQWEEWGSPPSAPGKNSWHLKLKEHEFIAWMLAMHFLAAMDIAVETITTTIDHTVTNQPPQTQLCKPFLIKESSSVKEDDSISSLVYGAPKGESERWAMTHVSCRTSFQYSVQGPLDDIIVSGVVPLPDGLDPALTAQDLSAYSNGWVLDVGQMERKTKIQLIPFDGLGYIDKKTALYGIPESGTLHLWLPLLSEGKRLLNSLVVCEVNEKRGDKECNMEKDLSFIVGGISAPKIKYLKRAGMAYLGKLICVSVAVPENSSVTPRPKGMQLVASKSTTSSFKNDYDDLHGVTVDVRVTGPNVSYENGACSISHVIWEELG